MILSNLIAEVRSRLVEPTARYFTDAEITRWLNYGYKDFVTKATPCEKLVAFPAVANQRFYNLSTDCLLLEKIKWQEKWIELCTDESEFRRRITLAPQVRGVRPNMYTQYPAYGPASMITLYPIPSADSPATTLSSGITSSSTTIPVASTANFPLVGYLQIGSEQLQYDNLDATNFYCISPNSRGNAFTTASSASGGAAVKACELSMNMRYMPPDLVNSSDEPRIPETWQECLVLYATKIGLEKLDKIPQAGMLMQQYQRFIEQANSQRQQQQFDRPFSWVDEAGYYYPYW